MWNASTPRAIRSAICSAATAAATSRCASDSGSRPSKRRVSTAGMEAPHPLDVGFEQIVVVEELGDRVVGACVGLALQGGDLRLPVGAMGMPFGIGRDGDFRGPGALQ